MSLNTISDFLNIPFNFILLQSNCLFKIHFLLFPIRIPIRFLHFLLVEQTCIICERLVMICVRHTFPCYLTLAQKFLPKCRIFMISRLTIAELISSAISDEISQKDPLFINHYLCTCLLNRGWPWMSKAWDRRLFVEQRPVMDEQSMRSSSVCWAAADHGWAKLEIVVCLLNSGWPWMSKASIQMSFQKRRYFLATAWHVK